MNEEFNSVNMQAFWLIGLIVLSSALSIYAQFSQKSITFQRVFQVIELGTILALALWLIELCIVRFSHSGKVCSGDYYPSDPAWGYPGPYMVKEASFMVK